MLLTDRLIDRSVVDKAIITTTHLVVKYNCEQYRCQCMGALFETKVYGGGLDGDIYRHHNLLEAKRGHKEVVVRVRMLG